MTTTHIKNRTVISLLQPFADFADKTRTAPRDLVITNGSPMAKRQLTMGDCYDAADAIAEIHRVAAPTHHNLEAAPLTVEGPSLKI